MDPVQQYQDTLHQQMSSAAVTMPLRGSGSISFIDLPTEIILRIIACLEVNHVGDMHALKSLALTCRKMEDLTKDAPTIQKMLQHKCAGLKHSFPLTAWTPRTLYRLAKYTLQCNICYTKILNLWNSNPQSQLLPIKDETILAKGLAAILTIDGIEDNNPNYDAIRSFKDGRKLCILVSALMYQEVFVRRYWVHIDGFTPRDSLKMVRRTLRFIFITKGPLLAMRILEHPHGALYHLPRMPELTQRPFPTASIFPGQKHLTVRIQPPAGVQLNWSLGMYVSEHMQTRRMWPTPRFRVDEVVQNYAREIQWKWQFLGQSPIHFKNDRGHIGSGDLEECLRLWSGGLPLL